MAWGKLDDKLHSHPKFVRAGAEAVGVWTLCLSHCCDYLTDGYIARETVIRFAGGEEAADRVGARLVGCSVRPGGAGLWEIADGGWQIHDYLAYNPSRAEVESGRAAERARKEAGRKKQGRGAEGRLVSTPAPKDVRAESGRTPAQVPNVSERGLQPIEADSMPIDSDLMESAPHPTLVRPESARTLALVSEESARIGLDAPNLPLPPVVRPESARTAGHVRSESEAVAPVPIPIPIPIKNTEETPSCESDHHVEPTPRAPVPDGPGREAAGEGGDRGTSAAPNARGTPPPRGGPLASVHPASEVEQQAFSLAASTAPKRPREADGPSRAEVIQVLDAYNAEWVESRRPDDGKPPTSTQADWMQLRRLIAKFGVEESKRLVGRYLADDDSFLAKQGHPLRLLPSRVDAYRARTAPKRPQSAWREPIPAQPETREEVLD